MCVVFFFFLFVAAGGGGWGFCWGGGGGGGVVCLDVLTEDSINKPISGKLSIEYSSSEEY